MIAKIMSRLVIVLAVVSVSFARADDALVAEIERGMAQWKVPGMAVAVVSKDAIEFQRGFGVTTPENGAAVDEHTLFAIASTTKAMIAAGVLILADEEKLSLDDLVIRHIPELHFRDPALTAQLTIRDMLAHRSGLPSTDLWAFLVEMPLDEQIRRFGSVESAAAVRSRFIYQNTLYELSGLIIERASGMPWEDFIAERLWQPIGMTETFAARGRIAADKVHVLPHHFFEGKTLVADWDLAADHADAAGSVWSSVHDMSLWAQFLLRGAVTADGKQLISAASIDEMFLPQHLVSAADFYPEIEGSTANWRTYGLGWFQRDFQGRKIDFHTGSLSGLIALIGLDRANDKAVVVLGNRDHAEMRHALLWYVMDESAAGERRDWQQANWDLYEAADKKGAENAKEQAAARIKGTKPGLRLDQYAGTYRNDTIGNVEVVRDGKGLLLKIGRHRFAASHWHHEVFQVARPEEGFDFFVTFAIAANGKVGEMSVFGLEFRPVKN